jgi:hypothetical protein
MSSLIPGASRVGGFAAKCGVASMCKGPKQSAIAGFASKTLQVGIGAAGKKRTAPTPKKGWSPGAGIAGAPSNLIQHEL